VLQLGRDINLFPEWLASDIKELGVEGALSLGILEIEPLFTTAESKKRIII